MYDMDDEDDKDKSTNLKHPFVYPSLVSKFTETGYSQFQSLTSTSINSPSTSSQGVSQCPGAISRMSRISGQSLSTQAKEYYNKYRVSNLDQYFSLPDTKLDYYSYQYRSQITNANDARSEQLPLTKITENKSTEISRRRRQWDRPVDIIGQPSTINTSQILSHHRLVSTDVQTSSPEDINKYPEILESHESHKTKNNSPTSSVASNRPLEWDNGADLGYSNLPTHEDRSSLLRLDPEGRTCPNMDTASNIGGTQKINSHSVSSSFQRISKPDAHSTQTIDDEIIEFGDNTSVTPITKSHLSGVITGHISSDNEHQLSGKLTAERPLTEMETASNHSYSNASKSPQSTRSEGISSSTKQQQPDSNSDLDNSLKKSASMNILAMPLPNTPLTTRSKSELNLHVFSKIRDGMNFHSTSSISTVVTKPLTCDKDVQTITPVNIQPKEILVSELINLENNNNNNNNFNNGELRKNEHTDREQKTKKQIKVDATLPKNVGNSSPKTVSTASQSGSNVKSAMKSKEIPQISNDHAEPPTEYETDEGGRASNSFEYFPGNIYQNPSTNNENGEGTTSRVSSSMETRISHSTIPNTSSSFDEKLWEDSDSLLRDLERSLHVFKSLVDANKCDKQVKKRLIHHLIKRLVAAKYTDDKIEHDLEENVPWNPDDTRNKVYRAEIIQALANKQKQHQQKQQRNSTADTDDEREELGETEQWKVTRIRSSSCGKRPQNTNRERRKILELVMSTENSDIFEERNTDRTDAMQDGRKARMGLRNDDRHRHHHHHHHHHQPHHRKNMITDMNKSESSECFLPQSQGLNYKEVKAINNKPVTTSVTSKSQSSSVTPNTTSSREISSQCDIDHDRKQQRNEKMDWRVPTTISERRFEYDRSSSRLGTATRLIDYVEMEKKNQLVWINSEINHLSNLKKLLEEPKNYENTPDKRNSPRKSSLNCDKRSNNSTSSSYEPRTINKQWSSHGNIAERCDKIFNGSTSTKLFTKRNSGTQTATINPNGRFSSDATPVSDVLTRDTSNVRVQTDNLTSQSSRATSPWSPGRYCRQQSNKRNKCKCHRPSSLSPRRCRDKSSNDVQPIASELATSSKKDAKNLLNDQCKSEFTDISEYREKCFHTSRQYSKCCCGNKSEGSTFYRNNTSQLSNDFPRREEQRENNCENNSGRTEKSQEIKNCRVCGTVYNNDNRQCQCKITYMKPIAYELSFSNEKKAPVTKIKRPKAQPSTATNTVTHEACKASNCSCSPTQLQLKDYLTKNKPEFVDNAEMRKRYMAEITQLRQLKKEKRRQLLAMASPTSFIITQKTTRRIIKSPRKINDDEMKLRLRMRYLRLSEVRNKRRQREKEEQARRNHLMAKIFCKKLQQKVLEGQVDVSQSVSVISNL